MATQIPDAQKVNGVDAPVGWPWDNFVPSHSLPLSECCGGIGGGLTNLMVLFTASDALG